MVERNADNLRAVPRHRPDLGPCFQVPELGRPVHAPGRQQRALGVEGEADDLRRVACGRRAAASGLARAGSRDERGALL